MSGIPRKDIEIITRKLAVGETAGGKDDAVILPHFLRRKVRQRVRLLSGREAGLFLPRGSCLYEGDLLLSEEGRIVEVRAAEEEISIANAKDPRLLMRIAYHLGNRHVAVQVKEDCIIYLHDHVLDDLARQLGAAVTVDSAPFYPEEGGYFGGEHHH